MTNSTSIPAVTNPSSCAVNSSATLGSHTTGAVRSVGGNLPGFPQTRVLETVPVSSQMTSPVTYAGNPSSVSGIINPPGHVVNLPSVVPSSQAAGNVWSMGYNSPGSSQTGVQGESINLSHSVSKLSPLTSVLSPLGDHIQQALRDKIARQEYIDLGLCLENWSSSRPLEGLCVSVKEQGRPVLKSQRKLTIKINTISAWTSAFLVCASLYLSYHPQRAQEILKYMHTVRSAAIRFGSCGWRQYDINFRMRQQHNPKNSWVSIDAELWFLFVVVPPVPRTAAIPRVSISQGSGFYSSQQLDPTEDQAAEPGAPGWGTPGSIRQVTRLAERHVLVFTNLRGHVCSV